MVAIYKKDIFFFRDNSSFNFMVFFFVFFFQMVTSVLYAFGIVYGSCGLILGFQAIGVGGGGMIFVGVLMIIIGIGFGLAALADFYLLFNVSLFWFSCYNIF